MTKKLEQLHKKLLKTLHRRILIASIARTAIIFLRFSKLLAEVLMFVICLYYFLWTPHLSEAVVGVLIGSMGVWFGADGCIDMLEDLCKKLGY